MPLPLPTGFKACSLRFWATKSKSCNLAWAAANRSTVILQRYSVVLTLSLLACCIVRCVTKMSARLPAHRYKPAIRSEWRTDSWSDIPCPVFSNRYTKNSVSLNRSTENVPGTTLVRASQMSSLMPAFQQYSGTLRSCSRIASECLNTLTYRQYDSRLEVSSGVAHDPAGLSARSLGGSAVAASSAPSRRSEGSRSPAARASTGTTFSIPSLESMSVLTVVWVQVGLIELRMGMYRLGSQSDGWRGLTKILILNPIG